MQSSLIGRVVLGIALVAAAVVLLVLLSDSGDKSSEASIPTVVVEDGKPVGGVLELSYQAGERIRFDVRSNTEDELHVHGYDIEREVGPGRVTRFDFPATIEGAFDAELHGSEEQIALLRIEP